jgi:agmatinase/guanidinopropionase
MEFKPLSGREFPRYSGIKSFFRLPVASLNENFEIAIAGVPFDGGTSYRPGARFAPSAIREASSLGRGFHWARGLDLFSKAKFADIGDFSTVPIDLLQTYQKIESQADRVFSEGKKLLSVGGDHSITLPLLRAARKRVKAPLSLIHFDAHLDTYPAAWGCEYHHGSFLRHAVEEGLVDPVNTLQIGIRGPLASEQDLEFIKMHGLKVFTMDHIRNGSLQDFLDSLPEFTQPTYLSFDIDGLDPVYAPGTGTPVPGGLTSYEVQRILRALKIKNLVAADLVEVSPAYDHAQITAIQAVDVLFELACLMAQGG